MKHDQKMDHAGQRLSGFVITLQADYRLSGDDMVRLLVRETAEFERTTQTSDSWSVKNGKNR